MEKISGELDSVIKKKKKKVKSKQNYREVKEQNKKPLSMNHRV